MLATLLLLASPAFVTPLTGTAWTDDPPVRVWFNSDGNYGFTDRAKVYAKAAENGYLIVLRADAGGRIRVLFPVDPADDQRITAGKKYELKGRGGREAFIADDTAGHGTVLAAVSSTPFRVDRFARDGHWDYRLLARPNGADDPETILRQLVEQMKPSGEQFVYDVATYVVSDRYTRARYADPYAQWWGYDPWWGYRRRLGIGFGYGRWYRPWF
ncbi:MAG TPA: DUF4384 domain-containing protein [Gemmatimonadales bacterium]|jgi:hypothetical protein